MIEFINDPLVNNFITSFANGDITFFTGLAWLVIATALSMVGGAIGGVMLAGEDLGYELAAILGGFFGPAGAVPATFLGLIFLNIAINN